MSEGWIKLHRCLLDKAIWISSTPEQKTILITLLLLANHEGKEWEWKGKQFKAQPGQFVTSLDSLAKKCGNGVSVKNVRTAIDKFKKYGFLANESTKTGRLITIVNWGFYQSEINTTGKDIDKEVAKNRQSTGKQVATNKNDKNDKNIYIDDFEEIWSLYPRKEGKAGARKSYEKLRKTYSKEELIRCVERYASKVTDTEKQFIKQGSTFFNGGYEDYLDINFKDNKPKKIVR